MIPTVLQIGPVVISVLGVMTAIGVFLGSFLIWQKTREEHFEENFIMDGILLVSLMGLISARILHVVFNLDQFERMLSFFDLVGKSGFSWWGALLGAILTLIIYCRKRKWDFFKLGDLSVFGLVLAIIFSKLGGFFSQIFQEKFSFSIVLVEIVLLILLYRLLFVLEKNYRTFEWYKDKRGEVRPGFLFASFLGSISLIHLIADVFESFLVPTFRAYQLIDVLLILMAAGLLYLRSGKGRSLTIPKPSFKNRRVVKDNFHVKAGMEAKK